MYAITLLWFQVLSLLLFFRYFQVLFFVFVYYSSMLWYPKREVISFILFHGAHVFQNLGKTINKLKIRLHETEQCKTTKTTKTRISTITTNKSSLFTKIHHEYHNIRYGCAQKHATNLFRFALLTSTCSISFSFCVFLSLRLGFAFFILFHSLA